MDRDLDASGRHVVLERFGDRGPVAVLRSVDVSIFMSLSFPRPRETEREPHTSRVTMNDLVYRGRSDLCYRDGVHGVRSTIRRRERAQNLHRTACWRTLATKRIAPHGARAQNRDEGPGAHRVLLDHQGVDHRDGRDHLRLLHPSSRREQHDGARGSGSPPGLILAISLTVQLVERRYVPWIYWFAVVMVSVFGTMAADAVHIEIGVPYIVSSVFFAVILAALFVAWNASEKTLSIHSIYTRKREAFYWLVVLTTFALGTATGDMTAISLHLGYLSSGVLFAALDRGPGGGLLAVRSERCVRVLVRLHRDAAARRVVRRLVGCIAGERRSRARVRTGQLGVGDRDRRLRCVPLGDRQGCSGQRRRRSGPVRSATQRPGRRPLELSALRGRELPLHPPDLRAMLGLMLEDDSG